MDNLSMFQSNRISMTLEEFLNYRDAQMDIAKLRAYAENAVVTYSDGTKHRDTFGIAHKVLEMLDIPEEVIESKKEDEA